MVVVGSFFINGLINRLGRQVKSNFDRTGTPIVVVFGAPVDFGNLYERRSSPRVHRAIAERTLLAIAELGREERAIRSSMDYSSSKNSGSR